MDQALSNEESFQLLQNAVSLAERSETYSLLSQGVSANSTDSTGSSILHAAVAVPYSPESLEVFLLLLQFGADAKAEDGNGDTPLHIAAGQQNNPFWFIFSALIKYGANINAQNKLKETPLHIAASQYSSSELFGARAVEHLLRLGADPNMQAKKLRTPLHFAISLPTPDETVLKMLLRAGADVNAMNSEKLTPLACARSLDVAPSTVKILIESGAAFHSSGIGSFYAPYIQLNEYRAIDKLVIKYSKTNVVNLPGNYKNSIYFRMDLYTIKDEKYYAELVKYNDTCEEEITQMKNDSLPCQISVWDFFFKHHMEPPFKYSDGLFRVVDAITKSGKYAIYGNDLRRIIMWCKKPVWVRLLSRLPMHAVQPQTNKMVALNEDCINAILEHLYYDSQHQYNNMEDVLNLVLAFDRKIHKNKLSSKRKSNANNSLTQSAKKRRNWKN